MRGRGGSRSFVAMFQGLFGTSHPKNCALSLLTVSDTDLGLDSGFENSPTKSWSRGPGSALFLDQKNFQP